VLGASFLYCRNQENLQELTEYEPVNVVDVSPEMRHREELDNVDFNFVEQLTIENLKESYLMPGVQLIPLSPSLLLYLHGYN
jgi:hypothetical protein